MFFSKDNLLYDMCKSRIFDVMVFVTPNVRQRPFKSYQPIEVFYSSLFLLCPAVTDLNS